MEKKETIKSVTFIIVGSLLQLYNGVSGGWASTVVAIFGFVLFLMGLNMLKNSLDENGQGAVKLLVIASILGIIGLVIDFIPLIGFVSSIIYIVAFVIELVGFLKLKKSDSIGEVGKGGVTFLLIAMILAIVQAFFGLLPIPFMGILTSILSIAALALVLFGWMKVQEGLVEKMV